ncbi:unnamed protein product [Schistosoma mattheei]|uniref:Uncharacterized protein n=1 Tax=Schistosoma mattheei TaxID=31246 RepID=A0A183Q0Q7_9TREM|nr:unnamed protein product [Schistosoma mattheei]
MKTSTSSEKHGIHWSGRMQLDDLDFTDDLALLSLTQQQMQEKTTSVAAASVALGHNTTRTNRTTLDHEALENAQTSIYLDSIIDQHGGSDAIVEPRIGEARAAYLQLKSIWNSKQLTTNTKVKIFNTTVKTVLLYAAETWRITKVRVCWRMVFCGLRSIRSNRRK